MRRVATSAALTMVFAFHGATARAESLLSLPQADLLERLRAPEARPRTRKGQVIYPSPGVPSLVEPGQEIVVRVRVRRALTPPPGVQQPHILARWSAKLVGRFAHAASGAIGPLEYALQVIQIRPEDEGFVYRVRLAIPLWTPPGVYDLDFRGPGIRDLRPRAVRVLESEPRTLEFAVVRSGADLWREAEALFWLDPVAVLVPGGAREGERPLASWPLATYMVPAPEDLTACQVLDLPDEVLAAARDASGCPETPRVALAACLLAALGGAESLDSCGDGLIEYARRFGPPVFAVGIGDVALIGLNSSDHPAPRRADPWLVLDGRRTRAGPTPTLPAVFGSQLEWLHRLGRWTREVVLLTHHDPEDWPVGTKASPRGVLRADPALVVAGGRGPVSGSLVHGPATITLRREAPRRLVQPRQLLGLEPGWFGVEGGRRRAALSPVSLQVRDLPEGGLELELRRAPAGDLTFRVIVPARPSGWSLAVEGRTGRFTSAWPTSGELCEPERLLLIGEISSGEVTPVRIRVTPAIGTAGLGLNLERPSEGVNLARTTRFHAVVTGSGAETSRAFWSLGDGSSATGNSISHRYRRSGPAQACAIVLTPTGRHATASWTMNVHRWARGRAENSPLRRGLAWGMIAAAIFALLLGAWMGNIFLPRHRSS